MQAILLLASGASLLKNEFLLEMIVFVLAAILVLIGSWAKDYIARVIHDRHIRPGKLRADLDRDRKIYAILGGLLAELEADRVSLFLLHNGGNFSNGEIMRKASCLYEAVKPGTVPALDDRQDMFTSSRPELMQAILNGQDKAVILRMEDMTSGIWKSRLAALGTTTIAQKTLRKGVSVIGFVSVEWCRNSTPETGGEALHRLCEACEVCEGFLYGSN